MIALEQKRHNEACVLLGKSLHIATEPGYMTLMLSSIASFASNFSKTGQPARAGQLAALAQSHPANSFYSQRGVEDEVLVNLKDVLTEDELAAAIEQGKRLDLNTVARELLNRVR